MFRGFKTQLGTISAPRGKIRRKKDSRSLHLLLSHTHPLLVPVQVRVQVQAPTAFLGFLVVVLLTTARPVRVQMDEG